MMLIQTHIGPSEIHGTGLYASEAIKAGTVIWRYVPFFDHAYTEAELAVFPAVALRFLAMYCYKSKITGRYVLCSDFARHMNHSETPNCGEMQEPGSTEYSTVVIHDVANGEELTEDYSSFEDESDGGNILLPLLMADGIKDPRL